MTRTDKRRPHLVMLHGWGMHSGLFRPWVEKLQTRWVVHSVDLPGHGANRHVPLAADIQQAAGQIQALTRHVPAATWLGWSLGGLLAARMAWEYPERVKRLVMLCASPCFVRRADWPHGVAPQVLEKFGQDLQRDVHQTLQRFMALEVLGCANEKELFKTLKQLATQSPEPSASALEAGLQLLQQTDLRPQLSRLRQPVLWLAGRRDRLVSPLAVRQAASLTGSALKKAAPVAYREIPGAGHAPFLTHMDLLTKNLHEFCHLPQHNVSI